MSGLVFAYRKRPTTVLACAAGVGFVLAHVLAQLRVGRGLIRTGTLIASGLAWRLLRQFIERRI